MQNLLVLIKEPSLVAFVAQHTLFLQITFLYASNKNSLTQQEKTQMFRGKKSLEDFLIT